MSVLDQINRMVAHNKTVSNPVNTLTLAVRSKTLRRVLKIKAKEPLIYEGIALRCIGSRRWRLENTRGDSA